MNASREPLGRPEPWPAPGKLNLFLHVVGRRADGYHLLQTAFQFIDLCDGIRLWRRPAGVIERVGELPGVPAESDLVIRAAVTDMGRARLRIDYAVVGSDGTARASGHTAHAVLDEAGRPQRIPAEFRAAALASQRDAGGGPARD